MQDLISKYKQAVLLITKEQEKIVGKQVAIALSKQVQNLEIKNGSVNIEGDPKTVLQNLIDQYATLFGKASIEVSKQALKKLDNKFDKSEMPDNLK